MTTDDGPQNRLTQIPEMPESNDTGGRLHDHAQPQLAPSKSSAARGVSPANCLSHSLDLLRDTYNYNHWIYSLLRPHIGSRVLEIGSGPGNLTRFLLSCDRLVCLEPEAEYAASIEDLVEVHRNVHCIVGSVEDIPGLGVDEQSFSTAVCLNVLEHIEDDVNALRNILRCLEPGGKLLLYVPACPWAFGELDRRLGHYRRYTRTSLRDRAREAGFAVHRCHFVNFLGAFGWWLESRLRRAETLDPRKARAVDRVVPYLSALERLARPPVGQSLFLVGERPR